MLVALFAYAGLAIWPLSLLLRPRLPHNRWLLTLFLVQLSGLFLALVYWQYLVRIGHQDILHALFGVWLVGFVCTGLSAIVLILAFLDSRR